MNIIKRVEMQNFRGYADNNNVIEFKQGINLVLGDNATGKSTIVALLLFNLLGKKVDVTRFEDYRTIEPKDLSSFRSRLNIFGIDSKDYAFEKVYSGRGSIKDHIYIEGKELKKYGQWEFSRSKDVLDFISDRFGARKEILEDIIIQTQDPEKLLWPVRDSKSVGKELSKLLRVEELQNIYTNAKSCEKMLIEKRVRWQNEAVEIEKQIEDRELGPPKEYKALIRKIDLAKRKLSRQSKELERQKGKTKNNRNNLKRQFDSLKSDSGFLLNTQKQIISLTQELKGITKPKSSKGTLENSKRELEKSQQTTQQQLDEINTKIGGFRKSEQDAKKQLTKFRSQQKTYLQEYDELSRKLIKLGISQTPDTINGLLKLLKSTSKKKDKLTQEGGGLKQQAKSENAFKKILSEVKADCPVCDTELTPVKRKKILEEKTKIITQLKTQLKMNQKETTTAEKIVDILNSLERALRRSAVATDRISEAESKLRTAEKKIPILEKKRKSLEKRLRELKSKISRIDESMKIVEKFTALRNYLTEARKLKGKLSYLPKVENHLEKLDSQIEQLNAKIMKINGDISKIDPKTESLIEKLKDSEYWYDILNRKGNAVKTANEFAKELGLASEAAKLALYESFTNYCNMISTNLGWIWPRLYDRSDLRRLDLQTSIEEAEEGENRIITTEVQLMRVDAKGEELPFNVISSHGQRVLASIAFRIAFLNLLSKTNVPKVLVLDEPTIWVDEKNKERLGHVLGGLVKEIKEGGIKIDQVIVISHDSSFLNAIDPEAIKHQCIKNDDGFCEISTLI